MASIICVKRKRTDQPIPSFVFEEIAKEVVRPKTFLDSLSSLSLTQAEPTQNSSGNYLLKKRRVCRLLSNENENEKSKAPTIPPGFPDLSTIEPLDYHQIKKKTATDKTYIPTVPPAVHKKAQPEVPTNKILREFGKKHRQNENILLNDEPLIRQHVSLQKNSYKNRPYRKKNPQFRLCDDDSDFEEEDQPEEEEDVVVVDRRKVDEEILKVWNGVEQQETEEKKKEKVEEEVLDYYYFDEMELSPNGEDFYQHSDYFCYQVESFAYRPEQEYDSDEFEDRYASDDPDSNAEDNPYNSYPEDNSSSNSDQDYDRDDEGYDSDNDERYF